MGKTIKLASVLLKCGLGTGGSDSKKKISVNTFVSPVLLICLLPVMYYLFRGGMVLQELFGDMDRDGLMIGFFLFLISAFIFCTGIATCVNSFYLSSNLNTLLVMPFTPGQITGAKFIAAAIYEYGISLTVLAPVLIGYGYAMEAPASFWVGTFLSVLFLPIAPLAYASILTMIVMRFIGGAKNKERLTALGAVAAMLFLTVYEIIQGATKGMKIGAVEDVITHLAKLLNRVNGIFPDIPFLVRVMREADWLSAVWSLLSVAVILAVFLITAKYLYIAGAVGMQDTSASHKKLTQKQIEKESRRNPVVKSYTRKELRTIFRTPAYYTSCLFLTLGWPLVLILPVFFSKAEQTKILGVENILLRPESSVYFIFILFSIVFAITVLASTLNAIAPSAISREGQSFQIMKQLPIPYRKQLRAKQNAALIICGIGSGGYLLIGEVILILTKGLPWWSVFPTVLFNLFLLYIIVDLEMIYGLMKPKLVWESEGDVAAKNKICFVLFLLGIVVGCVMIFGLDGWVKSLTCSPWVFFLGLCGILAALAFLINRILYLYGERRLERLS